MCVGDDRSQPARAAAWTRSPRRCSSAIAPIISALAVSCCVRSAMATLSLVARALDAERLLMRLNACAFDRGLEGRQSAASCEMASCSPRAPNFKVAVGILQPLPRQGGEEERWRALASAASDLAASICACMVEMYCLISLAVGGGCFAAS